MATVPHVPGIPRILGMSPLERPDPGLAAAVSRAGGLGVLDLGRDPVRGARALAQLARAVRAFGVRVPEGCELGDAELPPQATVVIASGAAQVARFLSRAVLVQVTSEAEARAAIAAGAHGLVAKGCEAGGRIGDETTFVLVQRLAETIRAPFWAQGGIGLHAAAACIAGGAAGVVIDSQLALVRESSLPPEVRAAIGAMDGSETVVIAGHRVYTRPDLPVARLGGPALDAAAVRARLGGDDLARCLLPIGQDGAFARPLAARFPTAHQLVRGLETAIEGGLAAAVELQPLAPHAPFAAQHGLLYPIAQGPMSRVSDRARFAEAVARGGGLPFLALTLMSGPEVRDLLLETRMFVGDRPWGVGILGFVPPEIREQQLEVLREIPPPIALIAGGRPSQAHPLEAQGTATYLHVPSPGLLDLFLRDGARRFVFEGSECGGHVGPRTSFALWEAQLARLLAQPSCDDLSVLFAGGIHDARSAAMVAAMAAPLAARGAKLGVLMGTAYLFTHEAVAAGAIEPGFQAAAVACERTVLLETSPGHATRCADTAYAAEFAREKQRLEAARVPAKELWAALEQQNLGRLRIAAKGLRREGEQIVAADAAAQQREGMYMIGQVAALRRATCSIAELHREVARNPEVVAAAAARLDEADGGANATDVAVIGIAAIFPGAPDTEAFWRNIVTGKNSIREVPPERWSAETYYDPAAIGAGAGKKTPCKWGGFLDDIPFDPLAYGIPPRSLAAIEPVQLLSLEIARRALADAGYAERAFNRERTAVIFGAEAGTDLSSAYSFRALFPHYVGPLPAGLDGSLPSLSEDSFPGVLSNVIAGRIANRLDLGGVNYTVDAACAASLAAVDMAVKELVSGSSDMVLCGGADLHNSINDYLLFASVHALSPTGQCHTFDASADGIVLGEGVACVVLKRLPDAERDGDRVYAVVKGVAGASDGKSLGLTAPRKDGQVRALDRAYHQAGMSPARVGLVEAHGTGTVVGDRTELATLTEVFTRAGADPGACVLGSVKSQIGHTKCAAGMAGIIKAALAIHHGVLPPTLNLEQPSSAWDRETSPFVFLDRARPWPAEERVAAVSAFGFGGANYHAVLTSHRGAAAAVPGAWSSELVLFRGEDRAAALALVERVRRALDGEPRLCDVARSACAAGSGPVQLAVVADGLEDLRAKLERVAAAGAGGGDAASPRDADVFVAGDAPGGKLAFLCPGQGSQRPGMLAELFVAFPRLGRWLELGAAWAGKIYPPAAFSREERAAQAEALKDTRVAQPALGVVELALIELLASLGVAPELAGGHSFGELAALCAGGALAEADLLALGEARGRYIVAEAGDDPGAMAAVAADAARVAPVIAGCEGVVIANHNSPRQCVLSGSTPGIEEALRLAGAAGLTARRIPVACAFHSPIVAGARGALARRLAGMQVAAPRIPVWSNVTAARYPEDAERVRELLAAQVAEPVRFAQQIEDMYAGGARIFVEAGPGQVLTRLVGEILGERPHLAVACDTGGDAGLRQLLRALGALAVAGVPVEPGALFWDRDASLIELSAAVAKRAGWLVNGHVARPVDAPLAPVKPMALMPAAAAGAPMAMVVAAAVAAPVMAGGGEREGVVIEYLRNMRAMIGAQRDVMLSYLGAAVPAQVVMEVPAVRDAIAAPSVREGSGAREAAGIAATAAVAAAAVAEPPRAAASSSAAIDPLQLVVSIVSERTGYPVETLGIDLDLEADLSIDSIKRIEIIGELAQRLGLRVDEQAADADAIVEELATRKTLRALVDWLVARLASDAAGAHDAASPSGAAASGAASIEAPHPVTARRAADAPAAAGEPPTTTLADAAPRVGRYTLAPVAAPLPLNGHSTFAGQRLVLCEGGELASELAALLEAEGASVRTISRGERVGEVDGLVDLSLSHAAPAPGAGGEIAAMRELFERVREAALAGARRVLVVVGPGAGGPAGLVKTLAAEHPGVAARAVELPPGAGAAAILHGELHASDPHVEVVYRGGVRSILEVVPAELPASSGAPPLDADSVVLVTGGARGITAKVAVALARRYGCRVELVGRSPLPAPEDPSLGQAGDARALRALFGKLVSTPAEVDPTGLRPAPQATPVGSPPRDSLALIEQQAARVLADREIRATMAALAALGDRAGYHVADVRAPAFGALIDELYRRHGRIDAVIHGAGVLEDKLLRHKTPESFERVFATKVAGARTLAERLRRDVRFVVLFSSISGAFGNRGQIDYAAAGDALDKLAASLARELPGRVVSIDWGPWRGAGMVSAELEREYARRGIGLIDPERGIEALIAELSGGRGDAQVILTASDPRALVRRGSTRSADELDA